MRSGAVLVIGYGNDLRGDDGAGQRAAAQVDGWRTPGVQVRSLHQLTPELAYPLATADRAVFLDAHPLADGEAVRVRRLTAAPATTRFAHSFDPQGLLNLTRIAFGRAPEAWWITIPALDFAFGAALSPLAERGIADALAAMRPLLDLSFRPTHAVQDPRDDVRLMQTPTTGSLERAS
jgi:hydrogenase maturation protease